MDKTREVMGAYVEALLNAGDFGAFLTEDVAMKMMEIGQEVRGRQAVIDAIVTWHRQTFDGHLELADMIVADGKAGAELVFVGVHTGEFAGIPATGKNLRVPYTAFYTVVGEKIAEIRLYGLASGIVAQLTAGATDTAAA